ncbi:hypothetical protein MRX96_003694 [Rhipicephalus microplus]
MPPTEVDKEPLFILRFAMADSSTPFARDDRSKRKEWESQFRHGFIGGAPNYVAVVVERQEVYRAPESTDRSARRCLREAGRRRRVEATVVHFAVEHAEMRGLADSVRAPGRAFGARSRIMEHRGSMMHRWRLFPSSGPLAMSGCEPFAVSPADI